MDNSAVNALFPKAEAFLLSRDFFSLWESGQESTEEAFGRVFGTDYSLAYGKTPHSVMVYGLLREFYKNEYYVKRAFILSHLMDKNAVTFFELPIRNSRIDLCSVNGKSVAYEIKTKFDSLARLSKQLEDYATCFEERYVICDSEKLNEVLDSVDQSVGIYCYDSDRLNCAFHKIRAATKPDHLLLDAKTQLEIIPLKDIRRLLGAHNREEALKKSSQTINEAFKAYLKGRYEPRWQALRQECLELKRAF